MARKNPKKASAIRLKKLLPKKKPFIIMMPEERDEGVHWLFWVLVLLVVVFLISLVVVSWQASSTSLTYLF